MLGPVTFPSPAHPLACRPRRPPPPPQVCGGRTGHTEAVQLTYRPSEVTYDRLCDAFFAKIDPTQVRAAVHPPGWF